jgi:hypothetical protein
MAVSVGDIFSALQNGTQAVNGLTKQVRAIFPLAAELSVSARSTIGAVTFDSSAAVGLIAVTTSSGFIGWIPFYPSS